MQMAITTLCTVDLRSNLNEQFGVKVKSRTLSLKIFTCNVHLSLNTLVYDILPPSIVRTVIGALLGPSPILLLAETRMT